MLLLIVILSNGTVSEKFRLMLMLFHLKSIKDVARELFLIYAIKVEKIVCAVKKDNICTIKKEKKKKMKRSISDFSRIWQ